MLHLLGNIGEVLLALALFATSYVFYFSMENERIKERYLVLMALFFILLDIGSDILRNIGFSSPVLDVAGSSGEVVGSILIFLMLFMVRRGRVRIKLDFSKPPAGEAELDIAPGLFLLETGREELICKLSKGRKSLIISRKREDYWCSLGCDALVLWLSKVDEDNTIHPRRLEYLNHVIVQFMHEKGEKLVFLDGVEYLIIENGFDSVFKFLTSLKDYSLMNNTMVIVEVDEKVLGEKEEALLKREFKDMAIS
ncbi:DUF835 domain-containing protein [Thermococcus sp. Bubb.Bath]|uniref:DUF835 domain-containing protein n=1 Tax=Thermococcus sp. Bubb.Bath TaxID=1638242 RepID=UPI001F0D354E|nr:DUF835 domain-containing protein [Thermococcus sp. Bubb.Bath]